MNQPLVFGSLIALALLTGCATRSSASQAPQHTPEPPAASLEERRAQRQFRAEVHRENMGGDALESQVVYVSGERVRVEMKSGAREGVQIFLGPGAGILFLNPQERVFARMAPNPLFEGAARILDVANPEDPCQGVEEATCERLEEATHEGRKVTVWREVINGRGSRQIWVDEALAYALRMETEAGAVLELRKLRVEPVEASLFEAPAGYTEHTAPATE